MNLRYIALCVLLGAAILTGCTPKARMEQMVITPGDLKKHQGNAKLKHTLVVKTVLGGECN